MAEDKKQTKNPQPGNLPKEVPPELKEKFDKIKKKLDTFKDKVLKEFNEYIIGIALMPPKKFLNQRFPERAGENLPPEVKKEESKDEKENPNEINAFILVDDSDSKKMSKLELKEKLGKIIEKIGKDVDKDIVTETMVLSELKESCYDGKYDILQVIAMSAPIYDPKEMLGAIKISEVHKTMVLKKFDKYIVSYVAAGSLFRGDKKSHDIDVYIIVDDTDVKRMSRYELKDKLRSIIISQGFEARNITGVNKEFHIQTYILTDFWDSVKDANPVIFTFLRDGVPLFDRGVFNPWRLLLKMGRIKPSPEAIDQQMEIGEKLLERVNGKMISVVAEDLYYAVLNPAQAVLMAYGINPPTPLETIDLLREIFVKKEKLLEEKYVKHLENVRTLYKKIEHGKLKEIEGKEIDKLVKETKEYLEKIKKLFKEIDKKKEGEGSKDIYNACVAITRDVLSIFNVNDTKDPEAELKKLSSKGDIPVKYYEIFKKVNSLGKQKLSKTESEKIKREAREYLKVMMELIQRKQNIQLENAKLRIKYDSNKLGEVYVFDDTVFIIKDLKSKDQVEKTVIKNKQFTSIEKSSLKELEEVSMKNQSTKRISISNDFYKELEDIFGAEFEIIV
ncbi:hypothetical protein CL617_01590 [archaeon]|nr:hypothetical protein [archaeon]|tara:strand:- start:13831 stop:15684 length:1854 start_codon:yes stop_codon:yes gene_type:complete